jgi:hypothetical protein
MKEEHFILSQTVPLGHVWRAGKPSLDPEARGGQMIFFLNDQQQEEDARNEQMKRSAHYERFSFRIFLFPNYSGGPWQFGPISAGFFKLITG